jgi:hypothetical protein
MGTVLTHKTISELKLPEGKLEKFFWDEITPGFGLRIRLDNDGKEKRSFVLQYRFEGDQRRPKLGNGKFDVDRARKMATKTPIRSRSRRRRG